MPLTEVDGPAGPPWERPLAGALDRLVVESKLLEGNPLGDPHRRPLWVYRPPGVERDHPRDLASVYVLQGFTGQLDRWANREPFERTLIERLDAMFSAGECPDAIVVLVDAWTTYGGSQFLDSAGTGPYQSYLCEEVVPFIEEAYPASGAAGRGIAGKSSGGYGAMVVPMMRPGVFSALASHAGDALFENCYLPAFRSVARELRERFDGSYETFFQRLSEADRFSWKDLGKPLEIYGYAACYSPDPDRPGKALLPFEPDTGRLIEEVWARWVKLDPVRMVAREGEALRDMRRILLDSGRSDEFYLELGAKAFSNELDALGIDHTLDLFEGGHGGLTYRYAPAIRELVVALSG